MSKNLLYISNSCFPNSASGVRVTNLSKLFCRLGYNVELLSNNDISFVEREKLKNVEKESFKKLISFCYKDLKYFYPVKKKSKKINKIIDAIEIIFNFLQIRNIKLMCKYKKYDIIVLYNPLYRVAKKIFRFCKKNNIKLIIDNTEWYEFKKDFFGNHIAKSVNKRILKLDKKINNIISISPWMNNWYSTRKINSICVLPLMTDFCKPVATYDNQFINLVYCGIPGQKDLLLPIINCIKKVNSKNKIFKVYIIGVTDKYFGKENLEKYNIFCLGKISREEVFDYYKIANFSCLFRNNARYAKAGFSTKVAESLSFGVPVLCNIVGGTDDIIENGYNGFKINSMDEVSIENMLLSISMLNPEELYNLRLNSYDSGIKFFEIEKYTELIKGFLER